MTSFTGTAALLGFHLRRDRLMMSAWILGNVFLFYTQAIGTDAVYRTPGELQRAAAGMESNAALIAMAGPARALDTVGGQVAWQAAAFGAIVAGLMSMFLVGRHTRAEEESGRDELVRAAAIGRHAPLAAAALVAVVANVLVAVLVALSLAAYGLPTGGSVALGVATGLTGLVFGAVALVATQLASSTRTAYGMTGAVIGVAYVLRAVGDLGNGALSWASPIGWGQYMRPYSGESWWPALLPIGAVVVLGVAAVRLFERRDVGSGLLAPRPGPARGALTTTFALAWRLQRATVVSWSAGLALMGLSFGSIGDDVEEVMGESDLAHDVFVQGGGALVDSFFATTALMIALTASGFAIASVQRLRGEESAHVAELLLAAGVTRRRWAASHLAVTVIGTVAVVLAGGLGLGVGVALTAGDPGAVLELTAATSQHVVPVLLLAAMTWLAYATRARWASAGWVLLTFCVVVMMFGTVLQMPGWLMDASPFRHLALVPAEDLRVTPLVVLAALTSAAGAGGLIRLERRDIG